MTDGARRVALLARPGAARDRLEQVLRDAGAEVVLVADPTTTATDELAASGADAVLVALEPAIEDALEGYDGVLADPAMTVIYDEAELAATREGWDAARWTRHIAAKLHRHGDVLPPGAEADLHPTPGPLPTPDPSADDFDAFVAQVRQHAEREVQAPLDDADFFSAIGAEPRDADAKGDHDTMAEAPTSASFDGAGDDSVAEVPATTGGFDLQLVDDDASPAASPATPRTQGPSLDDLEQRIAGLSLADEGSYGHGPQRGAVLIEGGLGGPDAVRQLLAELPEGFPRPIVVRLRLDGGRYDRLARQLAKSSKLPVTLAESGEDAQPAHVYFLPPELTVAKAGGGIRFEANGHSEGRLPEGLPPGDSAIVLLSGSDAALADAAFHPDWSGALLAAQAPEDCFDAAASTALIARGGASGSAAEIAERLAERWPS